MNCVADPFVRPVTGIIERGAWPRCRSLLQDPKGNKLEQASYVSDPSTAREKRKRSMLHKDVYFAFTSECQVGH